MALNLAPGAGVAGRLIALVLYCRALAGRGELVHDALVALGNDEVGEALAAR